VIAERQWQLALAVRSGEQAAEDSDAAHLVEVRPDCRLYRMPVNGNSAEPRLVRKVLTDGIWPTEPVDAEPASSAQ
jgi:hypothetical protein